MPFVSHFLLSSFIFELYRFGGNKVHIGWNDLATLPSSLASLSTLKILDVKVCEKEKKRERGEAKREVV